jgi:glycosyltransferase involved in cell wall biosynthesis
MRVLIISNYYPPAELGGWEQLTSDVAQELTSRGHQSHILTSNYLPGQSLALEPDISRLLYLESDDHINYHPHYTLLHKWKERRNKDNLKNLVDHFRPDIIYINGMWNLPVSLAKEAEELLPGRVVYYIASHWPTELDAHTAYWSSTASGSIRRVLKRVFGSTLTGHFLAGTPRNKLDFELVLCVSSFMQDFIVEEAGVPRERTRVVYNGIELDLFNIKSDHRNTGTVRLIYAGRLTPDKGVHTILESLLILQKDYPNRQLEISIYGSGTSQYKNQLRRIVEENDLGKLVHFKGVVTREEMPRVFEAHDVLLFPSIWAEPLARIIQEAMACGLVVIGTTTGGTGEILHDGVNGLTFEAENSQMLAEKIVQVIDDRKLRAKLTRAARQNVAEKFTFTRMVDEIEENFNWILTQKEPSIE